VEAEQQQVRGKRRRKMIRKRMRRKPLSPRKNKRKLLNQNLNNKTSTWTCLADRI
jgi:hypothetical protein